MMKSDIDDFIAFMEKQWPDKYTAEELASWARDLQPWDLDEVRSACITHKQNKRFKPFLREVKEILKDLYPIKQVVGERRVSRFKTVVADQWAQSHPDRKDEPESWLVMRYYRYWFTRVRKCLEDVADARKALGREPYPEDTRKLETTEIACRRGCKGDLIASGVSMELADSACTWIGAHDLEFEEYLNELQATLQAA